MPIDDYLATLPNDIRKVAGSVHHELIRAKGTELKSGEKK